MSEQRPGHERDETIAAVKPTLRRDRVPRRGPGRPERHGLALGLATVGLVGLTLAVFFVLPRFVERSAPAAPQPAADGGAAETADESAEPGLSPERRAELQAEAEQRLADLLNQQERLENRSADRWGGEDWSRYVELARDGDDAYLADDFETALEAYESALAIGRGLVERSAEIVDSSLATARTAFEAGNAELAIEQLELVLSIEPDNAAAEELRARAEQLPDVLELVERAETLRREGDLEEARDALEQALELDPDWTPAREALDGVRAALREQRFDSLLSNGYAALAREDWSAAREQFNAALEIRPDSSEARDGVAEADQGAKLEQIALAEARAAAFERRELWQRAIDQYEAVLETDPTLEFAQEGLKRARSRADLDAKLERLINQPTLLFDDGVLADARRLLDEARTLAEPETRLMGQVEELERLIERATTPVTVELRSDRMTEVTVYKVGELGTFAQTEIEVRPGRYTIVGSRRGYRDVRETITVLPGESLGPVTIVCEEQI